MTKVSSVINATGTETAVKAPYCVYIQDCASGDAYEMEVYEITPNSSATLTEDAMHKGVMVNVENKDEITFDVKVLWISKEINDIMYAGRSMYTDHDATTASSIEKVSPVNRSNVVWSDLSCYILCNMYTAEPNVTVTSSSGAVDDSTYSVKQNECTKVWYIDFAGADIPKWSYITIDHSGPVHKWYTRKNTCCNTVKPFVMTLKAYGCDGVGTIVYKDAYAWPMQLDEVVSRNNQKYDMYSLTLRWVEVSRMFETV